MKRKPKPKPLPLCPVCGCMPIRSQTTSSSFYILCFTGAGIRHRIEVGGATAIEAKALWRKLAGGRKRA